MKLLIDCHNIGWAAHHTTGQLSHHGKPTGVIYGFLNKVFSLTRDLRPDGLIFCWDSKRSYRKQVFPEYKKKEKKTEEEMKEFEIAFNQFREIREDVLPLLGFNNSFLLTGYEADDLIAWIVNRWPDDYFIISGDHDLYQLLSKTTKYETKILHPSTGKIMDYSIFKSCFGIEPYQWITAKAIGGCNSDKVPGIQGISDPGSSPNSRAIQYIRGQLKPDSKYITAIESEEGKALINRNRSLVGLPFDNNIDLDPQTDHLSFSGFKQVFHRYGIHTFKIHELMGFLPIGSD